MIILFAPSEGKKSGGDLEPINPSAFMFPDLYTQRLEIINKYRTLIQEGDVRILSDLFGIAKVKEFERYMVDLETQSTMKAIERYDGVAYDYLDYATLDHEAKRYIDENVILFSNLFGPISAADRIPEYKVKQGSTIDGLAPEKHYKHYFSQQLDQWIGDEEILDLRAGFYDKFYIPEKPITTMKFLKDGKVVSHWAKAYRGIVLRQLSLHKVTSMEMLMDLKIDGLSRVEINKSKKKIEIVYSVE